MDPNAALARIRRLTKKILDDGGTEDDANELAELIDGLDQWISRGGFLPARWDRQ